MPDHPDNSQVSPKEVPAARCAEELAEPASEEFPMLEDSLAMTPWERILANDDTQNFAASLRAAMEMHNAQSWRTATAPATKLTRTTEGFVFEDQFGHCGLTERRA